MITFLFLMVAGLGAFYTITSGLTIILVFKVFLPEDYPRHGISPKKLFDWTFNFTIVGAALVLSAYVGTHLPLP